MKTTQTIDNSINSAFSNPFGNVSTPVYMRYTEGNIPRTVTLAQDNLGRLVVPIGTLGIKKIYDVELTNEGNTICMNLENTGVAGDDKCNSCNSCGSCDPCGCDSHKDLTLDITPILRQMGDMRRDFEKIYKEYRSILNMENVINDTFAAAQQSGVDVANLKIDFDRIRDTYKEFYSYKTDLGNKLNDAQDGIYKFTKRLEDVEKESRNNKDRLDLLPDFNRLKGDLDKIAKEVLDIDARLSNFIDSLRQFDFHQIEKNMDDIKALTKLTQNVKLDHDLLKNLELAFSKLPDFDDMLDRIECLDNTLDLLNEDFKLFKSDTNAHFKQLETKVREALRDASAAKQMASDAKLEASEAKKLAETFEERIDSNKKAIECNADNIKGLDGKFKTIVDQNSALTKTVNALTTRVDNLERQLKAVIGATSSCPTPLDKSC